MSLDYDQHEYQQDEHSLSEETRKNKNDKTNKKIGN